MVTPSRRSRRAIAAVAAGVVTLGVVGAAAASLGGVSSGAVGADVAVIASCDGDGVQLSFTNGYDAASGAYGTNGVLVTAIDGSCDGQPIAVTLKNASGASLADGSGTVAGGAATVALHPAASWTAVTGVAVAIG